MKKILEEGRNCMGEFPVESSGLLIDGRSYYRAFYRAAVDAKRYILIAGWQFDSTVALLRGDERKEENMDVQFLPFLNGLCDRNSDLEIYILAWDFSIIYSLDRELLQDWVFNWTSHNRINFLFDSSHAVGASHHEKFVVLDGVMGFVGGMDLCSNRWDDRRHLPDDPLRTNHAGEAYEPYHDIQSYLTGPAAGKLVELFRRRWKHAGGADLPLPSAEEPTGISLSSTESIEADKVSFSRTQSRTLFPPQGSIREIRRLYRDAFDAAEQLLYIENQYFSSQAVYMSMMDRMSAPDRRPLQIVMVLPKQPHSLLENISLGIAQAKMLQSLKESASRHGHSLGIYYTAPQSKGGQLSPTYIHAKLLLVDDRFLSVGSANTSNRSMGLDTELNVSWEADRADQKQLMESICRVRISLLAEHCGMMSEEDHSHLQSIEKLVDRLDTFADDPAYHLQHYTLESFIDSIELLRDLKPEDISIDPEKPVVEENLYDLMSRDKTGFFAEGISWLNANMRGAPGERQASGTETGKNFNGDQLKERNILLSLIYGRGYFLKSRRYILLLILLVIAFTLWVIFR